MGERKNMNKDSLLSSLAPLLQAPIVIPAPSK